MDHAVINYSGCKATEKKSSIVVPHVIYHKMFGTEILHVWQGYHQFVAYIGIKVCVFLWI